MEMSDEVREGIAAVKQHVRDLAHPSNGMQGIIDVMDFWSANPGMYEAVHQPDPETGLTIQNPGPDPATATEKYLRKTQQAAPDWVRGMNNPRANFKDAAMAADGKWKNGVQAAIQADRFRRGMSKVDAAEAIRVATSDNGAAYTAGVSKRREKVARVFQTLMPALGAISMSIRQMPQDTEADREQRMVENLRRMRGLKDVLRA